jgi:hypothetical protein
MKLHDLVENMDDDLRWEARMNQAEDDKQKWRAEILERAADAVKNIKIPPSWILFYDLDESDADEPCVIFWAIDTGLPEEGGFADLGDLDDAFMGTRKDQKTLPTDYPHMSAAPVDGNEIMVYNLEKDLDMPEMDIGALHDDPEIAELLRKRQQELRDKKK